MIWFGVRRCDRCGEETALSGWNYLNDCCEICAVEPSRKQLRKRSAREDRNTNRWGDLVAKFRKRPIEIEAVQLLWENWNEVCEFANVGKLEDGKPNGCYITADGQAVDRVIGVGPDDNKLGLRIPTLEGLMIAREGDWIIKGVEGELYPCKPDIFAATYEPVLEGATNPTVAPDNMTRVGSGEVSLILPAPEAPASWPDSVHRAYCDAPTGSDPAHPDCTCGPAGLG